MALFEISKIILRFRITNTIIYLDGVPPFLDSRKTCSVGAVKDPVRGDPLIGVLSSLGGYSSDLHCSSKVHLQPLIVVVVTCTPRSHVPSAFWAVKSTKKRSVDFVVGRGSRHGLVFNSPLLDSNSSVAEVLCEMKSVEIVTL